MMSLYLSRARLRRDSQALSALSSLLLPHDASAQIKSGHHLIWALFGDTPERNRDFLWRQEEPGNFYILSERPPADPHGLFEIDEPRPFEPNLRPGDQLEFRLRANATISRALPGQKRGKRHDVVMDALHHIPGKQPSESGKSTLRAEARLALVQDAGAAWLTRQAQERGFSLPVPPRVDSYDTVVIPRTLQQKPATFGVMEFEGILTVTDPELFLTSLRNGLGRAKSFGCGLMLIRRAW
ncbi:type I-E CRISPR-associated protein Cas6/Cse3/CasE [Gluconobacter japonicus]|uniref:Type I-E CRISPR-associated protein Cas6/Cse3/CasE n=1 Tax=Gluconobacter japonicus TaxID=376620 RepID=A0ABQ5WMD0_GLUJA|nr:type I-E CRISPR-associated protein Cas6/Cse3/CasE [Gluconobacter japonicus]GBR18821.1 CRISPR-associated protein Cse3 [Gluconobacter japonicus NBRC 3271]GLQ60919.1 type I-E CRISPR-associated protein Cas6/Cse3/CasE [Gluconobacter japonicus]